jgi:hypothetical protein
MVNRLVVDQVLGFMRTIVDKEFPGSKIEFDLFSNTEVCSGFGISNNGGLTLVYADLSGPDEQWWLQIDSIITVDIPNVEAALQWTNARNRSTVIGKYYCAVAREQGLAAAVFETDLFGDLLHTIFYGMSGPAQISLVSWVIGCVRNNVHVSATVGEELRNLLGGRRLGGSEQDLTTLFAIASG